MNAIRESVRHEIDLTFQAEERARIREEEGLGEEEEEEEEDEGPDPVPAITRVHFEVGSVRYGAVRCGSAWSLQYLLAIGVRPSRVFSPF